MDNTVIILGARGSVPVSGEAFRRFGGATTCVLVKMAGQYIILDCGTGMLKLPTEAAKQNTLTVIMSHAHADHILGLAMSPYAMTAGAALHIYGKSRMGLHIREQFGRVFSPPAWPIGTDGLPADISFHELKDCFYTGSVKTETKEGVHPGGVSLIRLSCEGKSVVFMTDTTVTEENMPEYAEFAKNCDLLLCDGQYSDEQWRTRRDFGHSTIVHVIELVITPTDGFGQTDVNVEVQRVLVHVFQTDVEDLEAGLRGRLRLFRLFLNGRDLRTLLQTHSRIQSVLCSQCVFNVHA
ncbi:MAG: MBL fold metallo-hydrolase, partial [Clostridia bacterium]|nr:MBL fold metallo-hydrolase [Clostridia bacterium]